VVLEEELVLVLAVLGEELELVAALELVLVLELAREMEWVSVLASEAQDCRNRRYSDTQ
jgi:hypothetical protein